MDRVFLDANVLFSAAYRAASGLMRLWQLADVELVTSAYALEEAERNLADETQKSRLHKFKLTRVSPAWTTNPLPNGIEIAEKDLLILLDAIHSQATHLLTGDKQHFGPLFGQTVAGVLILPPAEYLASRSIRDVNDTADRTGE